MTTTSAALRRLGAELRRLREAAGRTQADVGAAIGRTHTTLVNWEGGKTRISKSDLAYLLAELRAPLDVRNGLEQLRTDAGRGGGEWASYRVPAWLRPILSFEEDATEAWTFQSSVIPGLLQTEAYARALHVASRHVVPRADVELRVAARLERQQRLQGDQPLRLHAVIAEAALYCKVGTAEQMREQLQKLITVGAQRNVTIQILPNQAGATIAGTGPNLGLLHFADPAIDPPLAWFDGPLGAHIIDHEGDVASLVTVFKDLAGKALPSKQAASLITSALEQA